MNYKITDYKIVASRNAKSLAEDVANHMKRGYALYGSPFSCDKEFAQALILPTQVSSNVNPPPPKDDGIYIH